MKKPYILESEVPVMVDCDDTLISWKNYPLKTDKSIALNDPYDGTTVHLEPIEAHIKLLKQMKGRGKEIVVWSAAGYLWASEVVKRLELEDYVDMVMSKPYRYIDDLPCSEWMGNRIFIGDKE